MAEFLVLLAPGRPLREGIERVLQAKRGALVVVGDDARVLAVCTGGFLLDAEFTPQRFSELAKMDGAIVLSPDAGRIARANVQLMPHSTVPTTETGTRHRTAERVARSIDVPVVSVSAAMGMVTLYRGAERYVLQPASRLHERASQALQTLQRFRHRFDIAAAALSALEVEDTVTVRDVLEVLQPAQLVLRIGDEISVGLLELGDEGRLLRLQLDELVSGVRPAVALITRDYHDARIPGHGGPQTPGSDGAGPRGASGHGGPGRSTPEVADALGRLATDELLDSRRVADALGIPPEMDLDEAVEPRGYRLLHRLPRFPEAVADRIVEHFSGLQGIMRASVRELEEVGGVGEHRARSVKAGLSRLAEASILDRYS